MLDSAAISPERVRPLRRSEYERLVELGCFEDERIELLEGNLVAMSPQGSRHIEIIKRLNRLFIRVLGSRADVLIQAPLAVSEYSVPEPDVTVLPMRDYSQEMPSGAFLVVEVADTSLHKDRGIKASLYARGGIPEYWVVNLVDEVIEVHTGPEASAYGTVARYGRGDAITLVAFPDLEIAVQDIL